jgi:hypothetical protein
MPTAAPAPSAPAVPAPSADPIARAAAAPPIHVSGDGSVPTTPSAKPGSAKSRMFDDLRKKANSGTPDPAAEPVKPAAPAKPSADPAPDPAAAPAPDPAKPAASEPAKAGKEKPNAWKLKEEWEGRAKTAEAKLVEAEKRAIPQAQWEDVQKQLETVKKQRDELEQEIRFVNYQKSDDFKTKYQQPYEAAWSRAMGNLEGLTVTGPDGNERPIAAQDILELVNTRDLKAARQMAKDKFGEDFANDVMAHRNEIRRLYDEQSTALEDARKTATTREEENRKNQEKQYGEVTTSIKTLWKTSNDEAAADPKHGKYFAAKEGDAEGNQRLAKGFELADRAFSENPMAPGLTAEQRKEIVQRHAVIRNRAAAFGRLRSWYEGALSQIETLTKELSQYKGTEPAVGGGREPVTPAQGGKAFERMMGELRKKAK